MSHVVENIVARAIADHNLLPEGRNTPVIATLSGGADSVALLAALTSLGYNCIAAHCNFHLRGDESMRDCRHAQAIARQLGAQFRMIDFDVDSHRATHGGSIEMACRELRYHWFSRLKAETAAQAIAVAHNADDNTETFFLNLLRGTSLAGLTGMAPKSGDAIIRPLLGCRRKQIEDYLDSRKLSYITDSSNLENEFMRNRLRNIILPELRKAFPNTDRGIATTIAALAENEMLYRQYIDEKQTVYAPTGQTFPIDINALIAREAHSATLLLYEWIRPLGFSKQQAADIIESSQKSGLTFTAGDTTLLLNRGILDRYSQPAVDLASRISYTEAPLSEFRPTRNPDIAFFDAAILHDGLPISVRRWQPGDRMRPFGMKGSRKVSDIFSDAKIPVDEKSDIPIITHGHDIIWIAGVKTSALHPVTPQTRTIAIFRLS